MPVLKGGETGRKRTGDWGNQVESDRNLYEGNGFEKYPSN